MAEVWIRDAAGRTHIGEPVEPWTPGTRLGYVHERKPQYLTLVRVYFQEATEHWKAGWYVAALWDHDPRYTHRGEFSEGHMEIEHVYRLPNQDARWINPKDPDDVSHVAVLS